MAFVKNKEDCCGCHACCNACPTHAIEMRPDEEGFLYPHVVQDKCIHCRKCETVCPIRHQPKRNPLELAYGCYATDHEERMSSSSGGVFSVFARKVLEAGGVVCGAAYGDDGDSMEVRHIVIDDARDLNRIKGTKYVQSRIGTVYRELKAHLDRGVQVLFSGTPCQVAGLRRYLGRDYEELYCIDLICHGVPSPKVFKRYIDERTSGEKLKSMTFRNKEKGISNVVVEFETESGLLISENYDRCPYIQGFIQNMYTRPSCFECRFKKKRFSDITIGDFWAIHEFHPDFSDDYGVSAVIVRSDKGMSLMKRIHEEVEMTSATIKEIACWNSSLHESAQHNTKRDRFFEIYDQTTIKEAVCALATGKIEEVKGSKGNLLFHRMKGVFRKWSV